MRRKYINTFMVFFALNNIFVFIILCFFSIIGPGAILHSYFSNDDNYEVLSCTLKKYSVYEDETMVLSLSHKAKNFGDSFVIYGENFQKVNSEGFLSKLNSSAKIEIISAPKYLYDEHFHPVVCLRLNGIIYLQFNNGKSNLVSQFEKDYNSFQIFALIAVPILSINTFFTIFYLVKYLKVKRKDNDFKKIYI